MWVCCPVLCISDIFYEVVKDSKLSPSHQALLGPKVSKENELLDKIFKVYSVKGSNNLAIVTEVILSQY